MDEINTKKKNVIATGNVIHAGETEYIELEIVHEDFKGCRFYYGDMKFADEENEDGSINMNFERVITNDYQIPKDKEVDFNHLLGDTLIRIIEDMISKNESIVEGGN